MEEEPAGARINIRIPKGSDLKRRLGTAVAITGIPEPVLVLRAAEALVDYIEQNNAVTFPIVIRAAEKTAPPSKLL